MNNLVNYRLKRETLVSPIESFRDDTLIPFYVYSRLLCYSQIHVLSQLVLSLKHDLCAVKWSSAKRYGASSQ